MMNRASNIARGVSFAILLQLTATNGLLVGSPKQIVLDVPPDLKRRSFLNNVVVASSSAFADPAFGRSPGSLDVEASLQQISTAASTLADLRRNWDSYAVIDAEGRAGDVDRARRVLGGVAPQNKPSSSPLYKVDGALRVVQQAAAIADDGPLSNLDLELFSEVSESIVFQLQKADFSFYSCAFAPGGTRQVRELFNQAKVFVDRSIGDFATISRLLKEAGAI